MQLLDSWIISLISSFRVCSFSSSSLLLREQSHGLNLRECSRKGGQFDFLNCLLCLLDLELLEELLELEEEELDDELDEEELEEEELELLLDPEDDSSSSTCRVVGSNRAPCLLFKHPVHLPLILYRTWNKNSAGVMTGSWLRLVLSTDGMCKFSVRNMVEHTTLLENN